MKGAERGSVSVGRKRRGEKRSANTYTEMGGKGEKKRRSIAQDSTKSLGGEVGRKDSNDLTLRNTDSKLLPKKRIYKKNRSRALWGGNKTDCANWSKKKSNGTGARTPRARGDWKGGETEVRRGAKEGLVMTAACPKAAETRGDITRKLRRQQQSCRSLGENEFKKNRNETGEARPVIGGWEERSYPKRNPRERRMWQGKRETTGGMNSARNLHKDKREAKRLGKLTGTCGHKSAKVKRWTGLWYQKLHHVYYTMNKKRFAALHGGVKIRLPRELIKENQ